MKHKSSALSVMLCTVSILITAAVIFFMSALYYQIKHTQRTINTVKHSADQTQTSIQETQAQYQALSDETMTKNLSLKNEIQKLQAAKETAKQEAAAKENAHVVAIDPGHQGWNVDMSDLEPLGPGSSEMKAKASTGTSGTYSGLPEFELNLTIAKKLRELLVDRGYTVVLTREDNDTAISNSERAKLATDNNADIYVRIHANGDDSHTLSGALTMVPSPSNVFVGNLSEDSYRLGECLLNAYCEATGFSSMGVQYYDNMTGINWSTVPVTIIEMGFMTNESDDLRMADPNFQDIMAKGIADGIDNYFENR